MSEIVKEKPLMEEVKKRYNNFIHNKSLMSEYEKKEAYLYGNQIMLEEERKLGMKEGIKEGKYSIAKNMKAKNMDIKIISELTGLSVEKIKKI